MADGRTLLVVLAGRPGTGKTTVARRLATELRAAYVRLDALVVPMLTAALTTDESRAARIGYDIAHEVARDNLGAGLPVVVDGIHPTHVRRQEWSALAASAGARVQFLETYLSDEREHRRRVELRTGGGSGHLGPSWEAIRAMAYEPWDETRSGTRLAVETSDTEAALAAAVSHIFRGEPSLRSAVSPLGATVDHRPAE